MESARDISEIVADIKAQNRIEDVAARYGVKLRRAGREFVGLSPWTGERTPSFYVHPGKQLFKCFSSGRGGDVISFVAEMENCTRGEAIKHLGGDLSPDPVERERRRADAEAARAQADQREANLKATARGKALRIWRESRPISGTPVETYLRARGVDLDALRAMYGGDCPHDLRFHPDLPYVWDGVRHRGPAMIGAVREPGGALTGIHRTWLSADGQAKASLPKAKLTLGAIWGGGGWLSPVCATALIGEGYETALVTAGRLARAGRGPFLVVSAISLGNLAGAKRPVRRKVWAYHEPDPDRPGLVMPEGVKAVIILRDADWKNERARAANAGAYELAVAKFRQAGLEVREATPRLGGDFADMVMEATEEL